MELVFFFFFSIRIPAESCFFVNVKDVWIIGRPRIKEAGDGVKVSKAYHLRCNYNTTQGVNPLPFLRLKDSQSLTCLCF